MPTYSQLLALPDCGASIHVLDCLFGGSSDASHQPDHPNANVSSIHNIMVHVGCFRCAICAVPLEFGECAMDDHLSRYGPTWFCLNHHLLPPKQKEALLERSGYKFREGTGKAKK